MNRLPDHQADDRHQESVQHAPTTPGVRSHAGLLAPQPERTQAIVCQLEYLLKAHGDEEARSDQCSLQDIVAGLRDLAHRSGA
jgi:hypothetical protein